MLRAINTKFEGYFFRSRLEARWAFFLSELGFLYEYEKEGFVLEGGIPYLPDFFIPSLNTWIEVKPENVTESEMNKIRLLSKGIGENGFVMLANGLPSEVLYRCWNNGDECAECTLSSYIKQKEWSMPYFMDDWNEYDRTCMMRAKMKRFEFEDKN
jgi:hypothetical protein